MSRAVSPKAPIAYSSEEQDRFRAMMDARDRQNFKRNEDIDLGINSLVVQDTSTGLRYRIEVVGGVLQAVAV